MIRMANASIRTSWAKFSMDGSYTKKRTVYIDGTILLRDRKERTNDFQEDSYDKGNYLSLTFLVGTAKTASKSINLTRASRHVILKELSSTVILKQTVARINCIGQKDSDLEAIQLRTADNFYEQRLNRRVRLRDNLIETSMTDAAEMQPSFWDFQWDRKCLVFEKIDSVCMLATIKNQRLFGDGLRSFRRNEGCHGLATHQLTIRE